MAAICKSSIKAKAIRVVRLDSCGNPQAGPTGMAVSEGFIRVTLEPQVEDGQEFVVKNADGALCVNDKDAPRLKRYSVGIELCQIDPDVIELMTGNRLITRAGAPATSVGVAVDEDSAALNNFGLELWTRIAGGGCGAGADRWFQWVIPWVKNAALGSFSFENGPLTVTVTGDSQGNENYGTGPFNQWEAPLAATEHLAWQITSTPPPTAECGYQTLTLS